MSKEHSLFDDLRQLTTRLPKWLGKVLHAHDETILDLSDTEFSRLIELLFQKRDFAIETDAGSISDKIDMLLHRDESTTLLIYRYWRQQEIEPDIITSVASVLLEKGLHSAIIISAAKFTHEQYSQAREANIMLIDADDLSRMIDDLLTSHDESGRERVSESVTETAYQDPVCPECGSEMVKRVAHRGKFAGRTFWGCSNYPDCKGIVNER